MKILNKSMHKLDLELSGTEVSPEPISLPQEEDEWGAVDFSKNVVIALDKKKKIYNKKNPLRRVTLDQLRKVYCEAAKTKRDVEDLGLWSMAKVNLFLRMRSSEVSYSELNREMKASENGLEELILEDNEKVTPNVFFNIAEEWSPQEEDFIQAKKDIKEGDLSYNFENIDELYVEPFKRSETPWENF